MVEVAESSPTGDVVLVVGPGRLRFRTHSATLEMTSEVFRDMLHDGWNVSASDHGEYMLHDDNPAGFRLIFDVIHFRNRHRAPSAADILEAAILAHKYQMANALSQASRQWLRSRGAGPTHPRARMELLAAAYIFNDSEAFETISSELILEYAHHYHGIVDFKVLDVHLPWQVVRK